MNNQRRKRLKNEDNAWRKRLRKNLQIERWGTRWEKEWKRRCVFRIAKMRILLEKGGLKAINVKWEK